MINLNTWLKTDIGNNNLQQYLLFGGIFVGVVVVIRIFKYLVVRRLRKIAGKTKNKIDDLLISIVDTFSWPFQVLVALIIAMQWLDLPEYIDIAGEYALIIGLAIFVVLSLQKVVDYSIRKIISKKSEEEEEFDTSVVKVLGRLAKVIIWGVAILIVIQNLGYDVTTLVAGLGIGGIAVAFALQGVLSDMFSYFSIYFDKPFRMGDFIVVSKKSGTVEKIGLKSTRLRTLQGEELIVSNKELTESKVHNFKKMQERRVVLEFGLTYETKNQKLEKVPGIIEGIISKIGNARFDRAHFKKFGDSALIFEVVYFVTSKEYDEYMDIQEQVNLQVKEKLEEEGNEFAYPTYNILLNSENAT